MEERQVYDIYTMQGSAARQLRPKPSLPEEAQVQTQQRTIVVREKLAISPFVVVGILVVAVLFALMISSYMQLFAVTNGNASLETQLADLQDTNAKLQSTYESSYDLSRIETYAQAQLGMKKASEKQIIYLDLSSPDQAVVLSDGRSGGISQIVASFRESFAYMFQSISDYRNK